MKKRILIDCTSTYFSGNNTGIQRVVRNLAINCSEFGKKNNVPCYPVIYIGKNFVIIYPIHFRKIYIIQVLKKVLKRIKLLLFENSNFIPESVMNITKKITKFFAYVLLQILFSRKEKVHFDQNDILLLPDSTWSIPFWETLSVARKAGTKVCFVIHDLIPIHFPQFCDQNFVKDFTSWIKKTAEYTDFYLTVSETTKDDLQKYLKDQKINRDIDIDSFYHGANLDNVLKDGSTREHLKDIFSSKPYLMVSTIEPRKNHHYALDVFDILWKNNSGDKLCFIGKIGWKCDDIVERIKNHNEFNKKLFLIEDANDTELNFGYENARALLFPSFCEGFGLPIVEALSKGLPVFASDIPIHHEIGLKYINYFDLSDPKSLANMLSGSGKGGGVIATPPEDFHWQTWSESAQKFIEKAQAISARLEK